MRDEVVVVSGGASGIGEATARRLASQGANVVIIDRNGAGARQVAEEIAASAVELDIADDAMVHKTVEQIRAEFGPVRGLVNCAGPLQNMDRPDALPMRVWDRMIDVHLRGTYLLTSAIGTQMARERRGSIVTIASIMGMMAGPLHAYGPAKAGLINLMQGLAAEWGPSGVRVNCVSPGFVRTPATERGMSEGVIDGKLLARSAALRRLVEVDEVVTAVEFLLMEGAAAITGCNLPVDAGFLVSSNWGAYGERPVA